MWKTYIVFHSDCIIYIPTNSDCFVDNSHPDGCLLSLYFLKCVIANNVDIWFSSSLLLRFSKLGLFDSLM